MNAVEQVIVVLMATLASPAWLPVAGAAWDGAPTVAAPADAAATGSPVTASPARPTGATPTSATRGLVPVTGVIDGDTIKVRLDGRPERVRVIGIDTPELTGDECYARQAASALQSLVQSRSVRLVADPTQDDRDRYGRLLRHVMLPDGRSAARVLIAGGFGREYTYRTAYRGQGEHRAAQDAAREGRRGMWGSGCAGTPRPSSAPTSAPRPGAPADDAGGCTIKGNINAEGEKIYHVPGGRSYEKTIISPSKGERYFCSTAQAEAAGWRAARG